MPVGLRLPVNDGAKRIFLEKVPGIGSEGAEGDPDHHRQRNADCQYK